MLPGIEAVNLRYRNVEAITQAILQALYDVPLLFERVRRFHDNV